MLEQGKTSFLPFLGCRLHCEMWNFLAWLTNLEQALGIPECLYCFSTIVRQRPTSSTHLHWRCFVRKVHYPKVLSRPSHGNVKKLELFKNIAEFRVNGSKRDRSHLAADPCVPLFMKSGSWNNGIAVASFFHHVQHHAPLTFFDCRVLKKLVQQDLVPVFSME